LLPRPTTSTSVVANKAQSSSTISRSQSLSNQVQNSSSFSIIGNPTVLQAQALLRSEFDRHQLAAQQFPPTISPSVVRSTIDDFKQTLMKCSQRDVCASCGVSCPTSDIQRLQDHENCLEDLKRNGLDKCGITMDGGRSALTAITTF